MGKSLNDATPRPRMAFTTSDQRRLRGCKLMDPALTVRMTTRDYHTMIPTKKRAKQVPSHYDATKMREAVTGWREKETPGRTSKARGGWGRSSKQEIRKKILGHQHTADCSVYRAKSEKASEVEDVLTVQEALRRCPKLFCSITRFCLLCCLVGILKYTFLYLDISSILLSRAAECTM